MCLLTVRSSGSLTLLLALETLSCWVSVFNFGMNNFASTYYTLFCCLESYSFLRRDRKKMDPEGIKGEEELGEMEGGEAIFRIYFMRKESNFNLK